MWGSLPRGREARGALLVSWIVLGYLVIQVVASMSWQVDSSFEGARHGFGVVMGVVLTMAFVRLQRSVVMRRTPAYFTSLKWGIVVIGIALVPVSDAWATSATSFAVLLLLGTVRQNAWLVPLSLAVVVASLAWDRAGLVALVGIPMLVLLAAGVIAVLTRMVLVLEDLRLAREEIARLSIDEERHRISRELHDILGRTLVAASLRTQTALRLVDRDPDACRTQLESVAQTLTEGQTQLRVLVSGRAIIGLDTEIATAQELFDRLAIECEVVAAPVPDGPGQLLAAMVLRESVTNLLKHSRPRLVRITVEAGPEAVVLTVANDGRQPLRRGTSEHAGTGLADLTDRVRQAGGTLEARPVADDGFEVVARLPQPATQQKEGERGRRAPLADSHR